jgi:hypothetical protein
MNPYASYLGNLDPFDVTAATAKRLDSLVKTLGPEGLKRSLGPGKWSAREILCHLADCEIAFGFRLRQTLAEDRHVMQPFDQELWARNYAGYDAHAALAVFSALRHWNLTLIKTAGPGALSKVANHPERGDMTFRTIVETMGGHDLNHLRQLETIAAHAASA